MLELLLMIINLIAFLVPNIYLMACPCCVNVNSAIAWSAFVRWTCWNTVRHTLDSSACSLPVHCKYFHSSCPLFMVHPIA